MHLLMTALQRALPFAQVDDVAVLVGQNLDFNVTRRANEFLQIEATVTETMPPPPPEPKRRRVPERLGVLDHSHAFPAAAGRRL